MNTLLISTYELGHQPFGLASPAAWLAAEGATVACLDLAVQSLDEAAVAAASLIAIYVPMHTATRLAADLLPRLRALNPTAHLCCFGLYAPVNEAYLRHLGVKTILGGEFETGLVSLYKRLAAAAMDQKVATQTVPVISLDRQKFLCPDRSQLPGLDHYAWLATNDGRRVIAGYTEASRGCKHLCRHCPIVPVYNGRFRIVDRDVVLQDIRQQVMAGAGHITFGDPDFLNGPGHAFPLVEALHQKFPNLTYDVTIKVEHLQQHREELHRLRDTGCLFVTSAVEAVDDDILAIFDKGHTRDDFIEVAQMMADLDLVLQPTFVTFTPWTTTTAYLGLLALIAELDLIQQVPPVQYAIRLLVPAGSKLLEIPAADQLFDTFDPAALVHPWTHPDPTVDALYETVFRLVQENQSQGATRSALFEQVWQAASAVAPPEAQRAYSVDPTVFDVRPVPRLSESWY